MREAPIFVLPILILQQQFQNKKNEEEEDGGGGVSIIKQKLSGGDLSRALKCMKNLL